MDTTPNTPATEIVPGRTITTTTGRRYVAWKCCVYLCVVAEVA